MKDITDFAPISLLILVVLGCFYNGDVTFSEAVALVVLGGWLVFLLQRSLKRREGLKRIAWFVAIWLASVVALGVVAMAIRTVLL